MRRTLALIILAGSLISGGAGRAAGGAALPSLRGDFFAEGALTPDRRTDIPRLLSLLESAGVRDYMHLVETGRRFPGAWDDFQAMAPAFQEAGIRLWLYLIPPSRTQSPAPFGDDFERWAVECARLGARYPAVRGMCVDDFNGAAHRLDAEYCRRLREAARRVDPRFQFLVVCYFGYQETIAPHVKAGVIDGVVFPYFYPHRNHGDMSRLLPQLRSYRAWLDERQPDHVPLIVMIYAEKHSESSDRPTPHTVGAGLGIALDATRDGLAHGAVTYCLPKDKPDFVAEVARRYAPDPAKP